MPSSKSPNHWALSELLGQRRLLGVGALLAWLVLFHLLVNVWLLCIFTSLLVVLGGWLGSRAALDANSLLHLEHFVPLGKAHPAPHSPEHERRLDHEIHSAVHKAVRDFVSSWYRTLLPDEKGEFERVVRNTMLESVMELKERARRVDRKALVQRTLELYGCHLQSYMSAREMQAEAVLTQKDGPSLWQLYCEADAPHPAVSSAASELSYSRALVNLVLHVLVPYPHMETRTGGYMVAELITCNVLLPLISRVSDPDWLNQTIVDIFTKSREPQETSVDHLLTSRLYRDQAQHESWTTCCSFSSNQTDPSSKSFSDMDDLRYQSPVSKKDSSLSSMASLMSTGNIESCHAGLLTPCTANCFYLDTKHDSHSSESKMLVESLIQTDSEEDLAESFCDCVPPNNLCGIITLKDDEASGCLGPLRALGPKVVVSEDSQWPAGIAQEPPPVCPPRGLCPTSYNFEASTCLVAPLTIQNVQITGTMTAKEQRGSGTHQYTLYIIKYEAVGDSESLGTLQPIAYRAVNRRYTEFLNLQSRLEDKPELKKLIKNVKCPKKLFPDLSFGNADSERVEARKNQLDTFLKQLSSIPEIAYSEDMQEFLALNTDGATSFERKPFLKSRIDKMVENALDTLKTAFPRSEPPSPTDDLEGDADGKAIDNKKLRLRFPSKIAPSLNITDLPPKVTYCFSEGSTVSYWLFHCWLYVVYVFLCLYCSHPSCFLCVCVFADTAVADVALNILCLLMKDQWSWLCTENIQKAIRLLFGTFIERWLDVGAAHLTSAPCWVIYLQVLQEAVWPGGVLPAQPRQERSTEQRQETKEECLECLMQLLPELITDMLGTKKYRLSLETMLESLQDHHINKHLIYCICDLLLEFLIPESCDEAFQRSLLHSLAKDVERENLHI
uniref:Sorting nexin 19a n=1 Tax=Myripristis murdjan TaxID=586833 RepID=A0A667YZB5_9TELE